MNRQERLEFFTALIMSRKREVEESIKLEVLDIQILYNHMRERSFSLTDAILVRKYDAAAVDYVGDCL